MFGFYIAIDDQPFYLGYIQYHFLKAGKAKNMMIAHYPTKKELKENIGKPLNYTETSVFGIESTRQMASLVK